MERVKGRGRWKRKSLSLTLVSRRRDFFPKSSSLPSNLLLTLMVVEWLTWLVHSEKKTWVYSPPFLPFAGPAYTQKAHVGGPSGEASLSPGPPTPSPLLSTWPPSPSDTSLQEGQGACGLWLPGKEPQGPHLVITLWWEQNNRSPRSEWAAAVLLILNGSMFFPEGLCKCIKCI